MTAPGRASCRRIVEAWQASHFVYDPAWPKKLRLHIALLTWRRPWYLERSLTALFEHTDRTHLRLWAGTDDGYDPKVLAIAEAAGFAVVSVPGRHLGIARAWTALIEAIAARVRPNELLLNLEEDWQLTRPLPMGLVCTLLRGQGVRAVRIWRARFNTARAEQKLALAAGAAERVWIGPAWIAHPPCVTTVAFSVWVNKDISDERFMIRRCVEAGTRVASFPPDTAPFRHIGVTRSRTLGGRT